MSTPRLLAAACGFWLVLWLPPVRSALESDMALHMAVQMPLLIALGVLATAAARQREPRWLAAADWLGIPGIAAVVLGTSFWMLPRALDQAIADPWVDLVKFLTLPLLVGMPLGVSWRRMPPLGRAFIWANFIPKLGAVGGLYLGAPTRLCAYYRLDQQELAGWTLIAVAAALGITWFVAAFIGWTPSCAKQPLRRSADGTRQQRAFRSASAA
jgi:cytochrome c oxidase assembly factor CtaG